MYHNLPAAERADVDVTLRAIVQPGGVVSPEHIPETIRNRDIILLARHLASGAALQPADRARFDDAIDLDDLKRRFDATRNVRDRVALVKGAAMQIPPEAVAHGFPRGIPVESDSDSDLEHPFDRGIPVDSDFDSDSGHEAEAAFLDAAI